MFRGSAAGRRGRPAPDVEERAAASAHALPGGGTRGLHVESWDTTTLRSYWQKSGPAWTEINSEDGRARGPTVSLSHWGPGLPLARSRPAFIRQPTLDCQLLKDPDRSVIQLVSQISKQPPESSIPSSRI